VFIEEYSSKFTRRIVYASDQPTLERRT